MKAFDVHAHLYDKKFTDIDNVIKNAKKVLNGVLVAGEHPESNRQVLELAKKYPKFCYASLGFHPTRVPDFSDKEIEAELKFVESNSNKIIAISETGLDYMWLKHELPKERYEKEKVRQINYFEKHILLAKKLNIPLVIHSRWSMKDVLEVLRKNKAKNVILHAFEGTVDEAVQAIKLGYKISIGNTIKYSEAKQNVVKAIELKHVVLETDSPVLAPVKGERNEPANVKLIIKEIAKLKNVTEDNVIQETNKNIEELFKI
ncbi:MAG: TatD family hydrolase [DPANN group archaeon]|nr:TatD family hydrolase [DPANN group archaeon]